MMSAAHADGPRTVDSSNPEPRPIGVGEKPSRRRFAQRTGGLRSISLFRCLAGCCIIGLAAGCSSGGSNPIAEDPDPSIVVSGTAAVGAPIVGTLVTLRDAAGQEASAVTDADGEFSILVDELTPPFLLRIATPSSDVLYGLGFSDGVNNIHPVTDLLTRSFFDARGAEIDEEFDDFGPDSVPPTEVEIDSLTTILDRALDLSLDATLDESEREDFDFFTTPFTADSTGFDLFLDSATTTGASITVTIVGVVQSTTIAVDDDAGTIEFSTDTTTEDGTTNEREEIQITEEEEQDDLAVAVGAAESTLSQIATALTEANANFSPGDLDDLFDAGYLNDGLSLEEVFATFSQYATTTVTSAGVTLVESFDADEGELVVQTEFSSEGDNGDATFYVGGYSTMTFCEQEDSTWLPCGNQRVAGVDIQLVNARVYSGATTTEVVPRIRATVTGPAGTLASAQITGAFAEGVAESTLDLSSMQMEDEDVFELPSADQDLDAFPLADEEFSFRVTAQGEEEANLYSIPAGSSSTESIEIVSYNDIARETFVGQGYIYESFGSPMTVVWTLPTTFAVESISVQFVFGGLDDGVLEVDDLETTATSATVTTPGQFPSGVEVHIEVVGESGQVLTATEIFQFF